MAERLDNKFSVKRITKSSDVDYATALRIYNETTPSDIKTNTNELTYWLNKKDENCPFDLLMFGLYLDDIVVGFSMMSYLKRQRIIVIEYLALNGHYRVNAVFFSFMNLLQNYIIDIGLDVAYFVVEISNKNNGNSIDKESIFFKKLICLEGFGMVSATYYTLPLGLSNYESSFEAFLFIKTNDNINQISKSTFLDIVHTIYYNYSLIWYGDFLDSSDITVYKQKIDVCFESVKKHAADSEFFEIKYADCPLINGLIEEKTYGLLPAKKSKKVKVYPIILIIFLFSPILIIWVYNKMLQFLNIPISSVNTIIGGVLGATITSMTAFLVSKKKL